MEITTAPGSCAIAVEEDKEDTATAAPSLNHITHLSDRDENELQNLAKNQAKGAKWMDKGKGREEKHGVMSLPAEIREMYAFHSSA